MKNELISLCIGAGAGFAIGMLSAPRSGEDTRSLIQEKAEQGLRRVKLQRLEIQRKVARMKRDGTRIVSGQGEAMKAALAAGKRAYLRATG